MDENDRQNTVSTESNMDLNLIHVPRDADPVSKAMKDVIMRLTGIGYPSWIYSGITWGLVIGILLLYLRYLTSDHLKCIFVFASGNEIGKLKKRFEKKGYKYIMSVKYVGHKVAYYLSQEGLEYYRSIVPEELLENARVPHRPGNVNTPKLWHDTDLRSLPCAYLMQGNKAKISWFTSLHVYHGEKPTECIQEAIEDKDDNKAPGNIIADGAIRIGDYVIFAEQDTGTQTPQVIEEKISNYTVYFNSVGYISCQLIFNVNRHDKNEQRVKSRKCIYNNIHNLMQDHDIYSIEDAYKKIAELINEKNLQRYRNMAKLLDDYFACGGRGDVGINAVLDYLQSQDIETGKNDNRVNMIKKLLKSAYTKDDRMKQAVEKGLSYVVTGNIYRAAYYINPFESGLLEELIEKIKEEDPMNPQYVKYRLIKMYGRYMCRNVILVKDGQRIKDMYIVSEISADISNNIMMRNLLDESIKYQTCRHIYFIVANEEEARKFAEETKCIKRFHLAENIIMPNPENKVTIRFINYAHNGIGLGNMYVPKEDGATIETEIL